MIVINKFPQEAYSLKDLILSLRSHTFRLKIVWQYSSSDGSLEVRVYVESANSELLENVICSDLSHHGFIFLRFPDDSVNHPLPGDFRHFIFLYEGNRPVPELSDASLNVLLSCIMPEGKMTVSVVGDSKSLRAALSVDANHQPMEVNYAFGNAFRIGTSPNGEKFFDCDQSLMNILCLPAMPESGNAMVTGYGDASQAKTTITPKDIEIGSLSGDVMSRHLCLTKENLTSSLSVFGSSGYGKSSLIKSLIFQLWEKKGIPFLVLEPAKSEYAAIRQVIPNLLVINDMSCYSFLLPPAGASPHLWADIVSELIVQATNIPADSPLPGYYREAYELCAIKGDYSPSYFEHCFKYVTKDISDRNADFRHAGLFHLRSFFRYCMGHDYARKELSRFDIGELLQMPCVINIGDIPSTNMKTTIIYFIIQHLRCYLQQQKSSSASHILVLEEAHQILGKTLSVSLTTQVANILSESRAQGLDTIIVEQSPSRLDQQVIDLVGNTICLRLTATNDQEYAASTLLCKPSKLNQLRKYNAIIRLNSMYGAEHVQLDVDKSLLSL